MLGLACKGLRGLARSHTVINFSNQKEEDYGVKFDEDQIRKKMDEIRSRRKPNKVQSEQKLDFMSVNNSTEMVRKIKKFRHETDSERLMQFVDPSVQEKPTTLQITAFDEDSIEVDNMPYPPSMILFRHQVLVWEAISIENLTHKEFSILKYIHPRPVYIIVGCNQPLKFPEILKEDLEKRFEDVDIFPMFEAVSQFNNTANDEVDVVAFLMAKG